MNPISKYAFAVAGLSICSCGTPAIITSSWHRPDATSNSYNNIFVAAITPQITDKQMIENDVQHILQQKGVTVEKSMDVFPPKLVAGRIRSESVPIKTVRPTGAEGILTITLLRVDKESRFASVAAWDPVGNAYVNRYSDQFIKADSLMCLNMTDIIKDHVVL